MKRDHIDSRHEQDLYEAILQLESLEEVESFFHDLCTPAELEGLGGQVAGGADARPEHTLQADCCGNQGEHGDDRSRCEVPEQR